MVDEEKVRIMTRIASFEQKEDIEEIKESGYYKSDYIRSHLLEVIWSYSIAYFLVILLVGVYNLDYLSSSINVTGYRELVIIVVAIYLILLVCCIAVASVHY